MKDTFLEILTPRTLNSVAAGRQLLEMWMKHLPELAPERFDNYEPIRQPFTLEAALAAWHWPFLATRRRPSMAASVFMAKARPQHATFDIALDSRSLALAVDSDRLVHFLKVASVELSADLALLHVLVPEHVERGVLSGAVRGLDTKGQAYALYVTTH